jgi:hypothetical protein
MKVKLEKWYLDFTSRNVTGFYYIMIISIGRYKIGFSGINHFDTSQQVQNFKMSRLKGSSKHRSRKNRTRRKLDFPRTPDKKMEDASL